MIMHNGKLPAPGMSFFRLSKLFILSSTLLLTQFQFQFSPEEPFPDLGGSGRLARFSIPPPPPPPPSPLAHSMGGGGGMGGGYLGKSGWVCISRTRPCPCGGGLL